MSYATGILCHMLPVFYVICYRYFMSYATGILCHMLPVFYDNSLALKTLTTLGV
jgi:hypothetical protein